MAFESPMAGAAPGTSIAQIQPQRMAALQALADRVAAGGYSLTAADKTLLNQVNYKVEGNVLKPTTFWDNYRTPIIVGAALGGGFALAALGGAGAAGASGASAAETGGSAAAETGGSALLGEGGTAAGLSSAGATPGLIGGAGAAGTAATTAAGTMPTFYTGVDQALPAAAGAGPAAAAGGAAAAASTSWPGDPGPMASALSPTGLFGGLSTRDKLALAGLGIGGLTAYLQSRQISKAVDAQTQATQAALAQQKAIYDQQRADQAPWRNAGAGAVNSLAYLMGVTPTKDTTIAPPATVATQPGQPLPANQAPQELNKLAPQNLGSVGTQVLMQSPDGKETQAVPAAMVPQVLAAGGRKVG